jgi:hypothetical protein
MLAQHNPFLLLQHCSELNQQELLELKESLRAHLANLKNGASQGTFSGEQTAEIKVFLEQLSKHLLKIGLAKELSGTVAKL